MSKTAKLQREKLQEIIALSNANPKLDIWIKIGHDDLSEHNWSAIQIRSASVTPRYAEGDYILTDEESILERLDEEVEEEDGKKREKQVKKLYAKEVKQVICVETEPALT